MQPVTDHPHRILAPRLVVTIGTVSGGGRMNIIPINNITAIGVDPAMALIAVYKPWITADNLKTAEGFTISVPHRQQLDLIWKLGGKFSGYQSDKEKVEEFKDNLDLDFSAYGPVLKDALGWIECEIVGRPEDAGADHRLIIGNFTKSMVNPTYYDPKDISPIDNPKPFMQWTKNLFVEASDVFDIDYYRDSGL
ncbi:MAG TPA: flavin reductase family protein [Candidatus Saccharimonadales bacterium]